MVAAYRRARDVESLANAQANLTAYLAAAGKVAEARLAGAETLRLCRDWNPSMLFVPVTLEHAALALALSGDLRRAARIAGYAEAAFTKLKFQREYTEKKTHARLCDLLAALPDEERAAQFAGGAALAPEAAIEEALEALGQPRLSRRDRGSRRASSQM